MREFSDFIFSILVRCFSDDLVKRKYFISGAFFGLECIKAWTGDRDQVGLRNTFFSYCRWEREFARRGYRTLHFYYFFTTANDCKIPFGEKRQLGEKALLYSEFFAEMSFPNSLSELESAYFNLMEENEKLHGIKS